MTYKKAKKEIDTRIELARKYDLAPDYIETLEVASEALERHMFDEKRCPICLERATFQTWKHGYPVTVKMKFCQNCGQAIDWSEE
jgi:phosphoribosyl-dephospho-CoA transferase